MLNGRSYLGGPAGMNVGRMRDFHLSSLARSTVGDPRGYGVGPWGFAATPRAPLDGWPGTGHGAGGQGYWQPDTSMPFDSKPHAIGYQTILRGDRSHVQTSQQPERHV